MRLSFKVMLQCVAMAILGFAGSLTAFANQAALVDCKQGGQPVVTSGLTSTTKVLQSFPSCTITVNIHGAGLATIFSDNSATPLANPFTAQNSPYSGSGFFYAANGRYDITISGGGIASPLTFSDILLNDPASLSGCSQVPVLTGDITSAGGTCTTVLPNVASAGTGLKTTINAKGQATAVTTAASTDLSDTALIARLNAAANFGANPISGGAITGLAASFTSIAGTSATVSGEVAPDVSGRQLGDITHRWDAFIRNIDISGTVTGVLGGSGTINRVSKFSAATTVSNSSITDDGTTVSTTEDFSQASGKVHSWNSDTGLSRGAAAEVDCGNGTQGDKTCSFRAANVNKVAITTPATGSTLTILDGKTLTVNKSLTLDGTDTTTMTFPTTSATIARTDAGQTFTGVQVVTSPTINGTPTGTGIQTITGKKGSGGGNYTSASTTYVVMDSTNLCYTVTIPTGWKLAVFATAETNTSTAAVSFFIALTDNAACGTANAGIIYEATTASTGTGTTINFPLTSVIAGDGASHSIALQFKTTNGADSVSTVNTSTARTPMMTFVLSPSN